MARVRGSRGWLGGILTIFLFGLVFYDGDADKAANLMILTEGLYVEDWSAFGAFVAAPVGGLLWALAAFAARIGFWWVRAKVKGEPFTALDRPHSSAVGLGGRDGGLGENDVYRDGDGVERSETVAGKFF
ncbi:uncharacterized protein AB675_3857 [Cyphellophora attinorum]|uniref:Uncharacterized protein n=1 Tax=Cyphellophora attinorum TaxID=1664694 RepID=A0A0N1H1U7_9EURO|nr:uncharacterized protein AB675_3857 [Phialophora attinorum]KPI34937.1 hypothetical protein AB675_3857 [Phialophora attinorum]